MTLLLVFLGVAVLGVTALFAVGRLRPPGEGGGSAPGSSFDEPEARLPAVLLPPQPAAADIARLRFSVGLRGYRMDQVDAVLSRLATALADRDAELAERNAELEKRNAELAARDAELAERNAALEKRNAELASCDARLAAMRGQGGPR